MKKLVVLALVLALMSGLVSCSVYSDPDIAAEYLVPFAEAGTRWNEISLLEEDGYGRKLYSYESAADGMYNVLSDYTAEVNKSMYFYIICQKKTNSAVYCYEDVCYVYTPSLEADNTDRISELKRDNDWNLELNEEKMTAYSRSLFDEKVAGYLKPSEKNDAVKALEHSIGYNLDKYYIDVIFTANGDPIFILREVTEWSTYEDVAVFGKNYVFVVNEENECVYSVLSDNPEDWREQIAKFRGEILE